MYCNTAVETDFAPLFVLLTLSKLPTEDSLCSSSCSCYLHRPLGRYCCTVRILSTGSFQFVRIVLLLEEGDGSFLVAVLYSLSLTTTHYHSLSLTITHYHSIVNTAPYHYRASIALLFRLVTKHEITGVSSVACNRMIAIYLL